MAQTEYFTKPVTLTLPTWTTWVVAVAAVVLIGLYIGLPAWRSEIIFATSVFAGVGVFLNAINGIFTRQAQAEQSERTLKHAEQTLAKQAELAANSLKESKRREAIDFMKRWSDPAFAAMRIQIVVGFEKNNRFITMNSDPAQLGQVNLILNFLETLAIGCANGDIDEDLCKLFFKSPLIYNRRTLDWYIEEWRNVRKQPTAWENFTNLAASWEGRR